MIAVNISTEKEYHVLQVGLNLRHSTEDTNKAVVLRSRKGVVFTIPAKDFLNYFHVPSWDNVKLTRQIFAVGKGVTV